MLLIGVCAGVVIWYVRRLWSSGKASRIVYMTA